MAWSISLSKSITATQRWEALTNGGNGGRFSAEMYPSQSARCTAQSMADAESAISSANCGSRLTVINATLGILALFGIEVTLDFLFGTLLSAEDICDIFSNRHLMVAL